MTDCINTLGSFFCDCKVPGYLADGKQCLGEKASNFWGVQLLKGASNSTSSTNPLSVSLKCKPFYNFWVNRKTKGFLPMQKLPVQRGVQSPDGIMSGMAILAVHYSHDTLLHTGVVVCCKYDILVCIRLNLKP